MGKTAEEKALKKEKKDKKGEISKEDKAAKKAAKAAKAAKNASTPKAEGVRESPRLAAKAAAEAEIPDEPLDDGELTCTVCYVSARAFLT